MRRAILPALLSAPGARTQPACPGHRRASALAPVPHDALPDVALRSDDATRRALRAAGRRS